METPARFLAQLTPPAVPLGEVPLEEVDQAIAREDAERAERRTAPSPLAARLSDLPRLLRWVGASVLVVAAFTFMLQSWEQGNDVVRYFHFLAFTATLTAAGFFCGLRIRDEKGARTFLGLAAGAVPVHFTVLGALLYSQFPWLSGFAEYPAYAHFLAPDGAAALVTSGIGVGVLIAVCWIAFLAFARPQARRLTTAYLLANAALLVPTRHPDVIGLVALGLLVGLVVFDRMVLASSQALRTPEGSFVRAMLAVPFAILIGRTFNLYEPSALFFGAVLASLAVVLHVLVPKVIASRRWASAAQYASLVPAAGAWLCVAHALQSALSLSAAWVLPLACLPTALLYGALSLRSQGDGAPMRRLAALVATGGMTLELVLFPGVLASFFCLATAIVALAYGYASEQRGVLLTGLTALVFGLLYHVRFAAELYALSPWGALALLGTVTVLAASLLERHHRTLLGHALELRGRLQSWQD
jgi:hypothetical protein